MAMFPNTCPQLGDDENVLLGKIAQSLCEGGGSGVTSLSVNGGPPLSGALSLTIPSDHTGLYLLKTGDTGTGPFVFTPSAANTTPLTLSNSLTGASVAPALSISTTWNTTGAPMGLLFNATDIASAAATELFDFQLNTVTVLNLRKDGRLTLTGRIAATTTSAIGHGLRASDALNTASVVALTIGHNLSAGVGAVGMGVIFDQTLDSSTTADTRATRWSTAWTVATHATRTAATTFNAFQAGVETTQMVLTNSQIQSNVGTALLPAFTNRNDVDTGMYFPAANVLAFSTAGLQRWNIEAGGSLKTALDNSYDIGETANFRPKNIYYAGILFGGDITQGLGNLFSVVAGANQRAGNTTMIAGAAVVANTTVTANTLVLANRKTAGGTLGSFTYTVTAGVGFTITSSSGTETSTFSYFLIELP